MRLPQSAVELYAANANACEKADSSKVGEDWYLTLCLKSLNVSQADMQLLLRDDSAAVAAAESIASAPDAEALEIEVVSR